MPEILDRGGAKLVLGVLKDLAQAVAQAVPGTGRYLDQARACSLLRQVPSTGDRQALDLAGTPTERRTMPPPSGSMMAHEAEGAMAFRRRTSSTGNNTAEQARAALMEAFKVLAGCDTSSHCCTMPAACRARPRAASSSAANVG